MISVFFEKKVGEADSYLVRFEDGSHKRIIITNAQRAVAGNSIEPLAVALIRLQQKRGPSAGDKTA